MMSNPFQETLELSAISEGSPGVFTAAPPPVRVAFGGASHSGLVRKNNEDHYAIARRVRSREILLTNVDIRDTVFPDESAYTLIVADGVAGRGFGELASEFVLRSGWELSGQATSWMMKFEESKLDEIRKRIEAYVERIHAAMQEHARAHPELTGMGTTWTCAYAMGLDVVVAHVGDSRAYLYRQGELRQLTRDHTFAQELIDMGMPPSETSQFKHVLTNSFAARTEKVSPQIEHVMLQDGDRLLLCTDGLTDMVSDKDIAARLLQTADPQAVCDALIEKALQAGGKDNVTLVVADFNVA